MSRAKAIGSCILGVTHWPLFAARQNIRHNHPQKSLAHAFEVRVALVLQVAAMANEASASKARARSETAPFSLCTRMKADCVYGTGFSNPGYRTGNRYTPQGRELMRGRVRMAGRFLQEIERFRVTSRRICCNTSMKGKQTNQKQNQRSNNKNNNSTNRGNRKVCFMKTKMTTLLVRNSRRGFLLIALLLACFGLSPASKAVVPPPDGGYPNFTTAEGTDALKNLTTGVGNTATGWHSLFANTAGNLNTAGGAGALLSNTEDNNTATGALTLLSNTGGFYNTADGAFALFSN